MYTQGKMEGVFEGKINDYLSQHEKLREKYNRISLLRIVVFLLATVAFIYFANQRNFVYVTIIGLSFPFIFAVLLKFHQRIAYKKAHTSFLQSINEGEIRKLRRDLRLFDGGERFLIDKHPYAIDLDVFGHNSLFQLLNRCTTESGKRLLAYWMNSPAQKEEIKKRQEAISELRPMVDWRQDFQASGMHYEDKESTVKTLLEWLESPLHYEGAKGYKFVVILMPIVSVIAIVLYFTGVVHYLIPLCTLLINLFLLRKATPLATATQEQTYLSIKSLKAYQAMIIKIEQQEFKTKMLTTIRSHFNHQDFSAGTEIRKLERILDWLNSRHNAFYFVFNLVFLIDIHLLLMAEKWKRRTKSDVA